MTAHAMKGDRERCLESGMDGYVSKPIFGKVLEEAIGSVLQCRITSGTQGHHAMPENLADWDAAQVVEKLGGNEELFHELLAIFLDEAPKNLERLRQAISQGDAEAVANIAHSFKGELGYFGISGIGECARQLEELGRRHDLGGAAELSSAIETGILTVLNSMRSMNGMYSGNQPGAETGGAG